jgi:hypothetical protein
VLCCAAVLCCCAAVLCCAVLYIHVLTSSPEQTRIMRSAVESNSPPRAVLVWLVCLLVSGCFSQDLVMDATSTLDPSQITKTFYQSSQPVLLASPTHTTLTVPSSLAIASLELSLFDGELMLIASSTEGLSLTASNSLFEVDTSVAGVLTVLPLGSSSLADTLWLAVLRSASYYNFGTSGFPDTRIVTVVVRLSNELILRGYVHLDLLLAPAVPTSSPAVIPTPPATSVTPTINPTPLPTPTAASTTTPQVTTISTETACAIGSRDVDLVLVLQSSALMGSAAWSFVLQFASELVGQLDIGANATRYVTA